MIISTLFGFPHFSSTKKAKPKDLASLIYNSPQGRNDDKNKKPRPANAGRGFFIRQFVLFTLVFLIPTQLVSCS